MRIVTFRRKLQYDFWTKIITRLFRDVKQHNNVEDLDVMGLNFIIITSKIGVDTCR